MNYTLLQRAHLRERFVILRWVAVLGLLAGLIAATTPMAHEKAAAAQTLDCRRPTDAGFVTQPPSVLAGPEALVDSAGVAAKTFAGFYVAQAVVDAAGATYVGFFDAAGALTVGSRAHGTTSWTFMHPTDETGRPVVISGDTHNNIVMTVDAGGLLHLFANMHSSPMRYWRSVSAADPTNLLFANHLVMEPRFNAAGVRVDDEGYVTYPKLFTTLDGSLRLMFRTGWSDAGKTYLYSFDQASLSWTNTLGAGALLDGFTGTKYSPYPDQVTYNPADGYYYLAYTWQDDGTAASTSTVNLIRSRDLSHWTNASGIALALPVRYGDTAALVEDVPTNSGLLNFNVKFGADVYGRPTVSYVRTQEGKTVLTVARRDGLNKNWVRNNVSAWAGFNDLSNAADLTHLSIDGLQTSGTTMTIPYACNGERRVLTVGLGKYNGATVHLSDTPAPKRMLPDSLAATEFPGQGFRITYRVATALTSEGSLILKWEAGPMIATGGTPTPGTYPQQGSSLYLALIER